MPDEDDNFSAETADFSTDSSPELASTWDGLGHNEQPPTAAPENDGPQSWTLPMRERLKSLPPEYRDVIEYASKRDKEMHDAISRAGQRGSNLDQYQQQIDTLRSSVEQHLADLQQRDAEIARRDQEIAARNQQAELAKFAEGKDYFEDESFQWSLLQEMRALVAEVPGLKGNLLLSVAHDRAAQKHNIPQTLAQRQQQEQQRLSQEQHQRQREIAAQIEARDREWQALLAEKELAWAQHLAQREAQRVKELEEHTKRAKRAASVNVKGSPGHNSTRPSLENDDATLREIWNRNNS